MVAGAKGSHPWQGRRTFWKNGSQMVSSDVNVSHGSFVVQRLAGSDTAALNMHFSGQLHRAARLAGSDTVFLYTRLGHLHRSALVRTLQVTHSLRSFIVQCWFGHVGSPHCLGSFIVQRRFRHCRAASPFSVGLDTAGFLTHNLGSFIVQRWFGHCGAASSSSVGSDTAGIDTYISNSFHVLGGVSWHRRRHCSKEGKCSGVRLRAVMEQMYRPRVHLKRLCTTPGRVEQRSWLHLFWAPGHQYLSNSCRLAP